MGYSVLSTVYELKANMSFYRRLLTLAALPIFLLSPLVNAGDSPSRPSFTEQGTVRVPAFELPPSEFMSSEGVEQLKMRAGTGGELPFAIDQNIESIRSGIETFVAPSVQYAREHYAVDIAKKTIAGVKTHVVTPADGEGDKSKVLINLHGGGFIMCAYGCALVESVPISAVGRYKVVTVDYRQGPEYQFPAATQDVIAVYQSLLKTYRPENIGIYGCSAGGVLTSQVGAWVIDKGLPNPGALGIFGAGANSYAAGDSAYISAYVDGAFDPPGGGSEALLQPYFGGADMNDPMISPAYYPDLLAQFPPTLLISGTRAADLSPAAYTHFQLLKAGARSNLIVAEGMGHCYTNYPKLPESRDTYGMIVRFFGEHLGVVR